MLTMRQVRRLDNGNTVICASTLDKVIEVSPAKQVVWEYSVPFPYLATRLDNGHTLISSKSLIRTIKSPAMRHPCTLVVVDE